MYECGRSALVQKKRRGRSRAFATKLTPLFFLIFFFCRLDAAILGSLRFGLFHGFLGFGSLFGAGFGTPFLLLVEDLLAAQQLEKSLVSAVTLVPVSADDASVSTLTIAE